MSNEISDFFGNISAEGEDELLQELEELEGENVEEEMEGEALEAPTASVKGGPAKVAPKPVPAAKAEVGDKELLNELMG